MGWRTIVIVVAVIAAAIVIYKLLSFCFKEKIQFRHSASFNTEVLEQSRLLKLVFKPSLLFCSNHLQVILGTSFGNKNKKKKTFIKYLREVLVLKDQGQIGLFWGFKDKQPAKLELAERVPILVIVPGTNAIAKSCTQLNLAERALKEGYQPVVVTHRGSNGIALATPKPYCMHSWPDIQEAIEHIQERFPHHSLYAVGSSIGGSHLANYLGSQKANVKIKAAVCNQVPFDSKMVKTNLQNSLGGFYNRQIWKKSKKVLQKSKQILAECEEGKAINFERVYEEAQNITEFEDRVVAHLHGFDDLLAYHEEPACKLRLAGIRVPTFFFSVRGDPICGENLFPVEELEKNEQLLFGATKRGGHLATFESAFTLYQWQVEPVFEFLNFHRDRNERGDYGALQEDRV